MTPIEWLEKNVTHLEHGGDDPTGFWPHKCEECCYFEGDACVLGCLRYRDLGLVDYIALRVEESHG